MFLIDLCHLHATAFPKFYKFSFAFSFPTRDDPSTFDLFLANFLQKILIYSCDGSFISTNFIVKPLYVFQKTHLLIWYVSFSSPSALHSLPKGRWDFRLSWRLKSLFAIPTVQIWPYEINLPWLKHPLNFL